MKLSLRALRSAAFFGLWTSAPVLLFAQSTTTAPTPADSADDENVITLTPFEVTTDADVGYVATNSLAGSRLNTPLKDTAASISVMTRELINDLGAVTIEEAMQYANNVQADIVDANAAGGTPNDNSTFEFFTNFRVRGIPATTTRNYFPWRMPTDSYNVERIEEQRGPNSILFGIGSAGGIINTATKTAVHGRNFLHGSLMGGSYSHLRGTIDANISSFDDRLAIRFNGVYDNVNGYRQHVMRDVQRGDLAASFQVTSQTRLRVDYEQGHSDEVVARTLNIFESVNDWIAAGSPTVPSSPTNSPGLASYGGGNRGTYLPGIVAVFNLRNTYRSNPLNGETNVIADATLADETINTGGPSQLRTGDFKAISAFLEQRVGENTFIELAYNRQTNDSVANVLAIGSSEGATLRADANEKLPNGDPNPNVGNYYIEGQFGRFNLQNESENLRLSVSSAIDLGRWGDYRFAVMGEHEDRWSYKEQQRETWQSGAFNANPEASANRVYRRAYVTPGDWSSYWVPGPAVTGLIPETTDQTGRVLSSRWTNQSVPNDIPEEQDSLLLGGQARYLRDRLILGFGVRKDKLKFSTYPEIRSSVDKEKIVDYDNPTDFAYDGVTKTIGAVGHVTRHLSLLANYSTNFSLPNAGIRVLPDSQPADNPEGEGKDLGVAFTLLDGKLSTRLTYYETDIINGHDYRFGGSANNPTGFSKQIMDALNASGQVTDAEVEARALNTNGATFTRHVEGYEFNVTANPSRNLRLSVNYSLTNGYEDDVGQEVVAWFNDMTQYLQAYDTTVPTIRNDGDSIDAVMAEFQEAMTDILGLQKLALPGNRKHKVSFFTRYTFPAGPLKGLFVGGGYRYQSKLVVGVGGAGEIQYGNAFGQGDLLLGYRLGDFAFLKNCSLQLNVNNLFDNTDPLITRRRDDGTVYRWKIQDPRSYRVTARFEF